MRAVGLRGRTSVLARGVGDVQCENGSLNDFDEMSRVAIVVGWSASARVSRSVRALIDALRGGGYRTVMVSACEAPGPLDWGGPPPADLLVLRRPNLGYDFGSWATALTLLPGIAQAPYVLLANDSMIGPFADIAPLISDFENSHGDVWGLTDTRQYFHHLQSYFLGFRHGVLTDPALQGFWAGVRHDADKWQIIRRNELALSRLLYREGYVTTSAYRADDVVAPGENPVIRGWRSLIEVGFPFVKREILRDPDVAPNGEMLAREVRTVFGVDIEEWV